MELHAPKCINVPVARKHWPNDDFKKMLKRRTWKAVCLLVLQYLERDSGTGSTNLLVLKVYSHCIIVHRIVLFYTLCTTVTEHLLALSLDNLLKA